MEELRLRGAVDKKVGRVANLKRGNEIHKILLLRRGASVENSATGLE